VSKDRVNFSFSKKEIEQADAVLKKTGSWLCALVDWAERRKCKMNPHYMQCMAQVLTRIVELKGGVNFIKKMHEDEELRKKEEELQAQLPELEDISNQSLIKAREMIQNATVPVQSDLPHPSS
jgi:hypothetical protein